MKAVFGYAYISPVQIIWLKSFCLVPPEARGQYDGRGKQCGSSLLSQGDKRAPTLVLLGSTGWLWQ